ncbi:MAG: efflux transporter outer membrane subunit [Alphaproteobacteria bacterium]
MSRNLRPLLLLLPLLASACEVGPDYKRPHFALPGNWFGGDESTTQSVTPAGETIPVDWWKSYNDDALTALIEEGLKHNTDLMVAAARVAQARAQLTYDQAELYPELDATGGATRTRNSALATVGGFKPSTTPYNDFNIGAVLSYEVDLWGKLRRATESGRAQLLSAKANRDAIRIAVASDVAQGYFNLLALDAQIAVTQDTIKARSSEMDYQGKQYKYGAVDGLTLNEAKAELAAAQAALPTLQQAREEQASALGVLLGRDPKDLVEGEVKEGKALNVLPVPPVMPTDLPSTLMERRPDIVAAEQQLVAANAQIGVAKADYFPAISLSALLGLDSSQLGHTLSLRARNWEFGGSLAAPLLDFGRTSSGVAQAKGVRDEALADYRQVVLGAFKEVLDAMSAQKTSDGRVKAQQAQVKARADALHLAVLRYDAGYSEYLEQLDAQRNLYDAQLQTITAQRDRLIASVTLYKALGGGWQNEELYKKLHPAPAKAPDAPAPDPSKP